MNKNSALAQAESLLLAPFSLTEGDLSRTFGQILTHQVDYADLYFQYSRSEAWSLDEGIVKSGSFNIDQSVSVRTIPTTSAHERCPMRQPPCAPLPQRVRMAFCRRSNMAQPAMRSTCRMTRLPRYRPRPRSNCWNASKASRVPLIHG